MGHIIENDENDQNVAFEIRSESVILFDDDGESIEVSKDYLKRFIYLMIDPEWFIKIFGE